MLFKRLFWGACTLLPLGALGLDRADFTHEEIENGGALKRLARESLGNIQHEHRRSQCRLEDAQVRKEWRELPQTARLEFIGAIQCLQDTPPTISADLMEIYPGVKSRYDEFLAVHIQLVKHIHFTADFLAWHRYFIHLFEQDLKSKCNFTGSLPYWEWGFDAAAPQDSPIFNGEPDSFGSNGEFIPNREPVYWDAIKDYVPPGTGGGCIYQGPFSNYSIDMGPINTPGLTPVDYDFAYNPHCVTRDLLPSITSISLAFRNTTDLILSYDTIEWFQAVMQKDPRYPLPHVPHGVHRAGHVGTGRVMADVAGSPGDPVFWIHHAQIDRVWTIWQGLDPETRRNAIWGTHTIWNDPPSPEMSLDEMLGYFFVGEDVMFGDVMDTLSGPFCYYYT
ncbi:hypothetical protein BDV25DRAFT_168743 [Aspergillus avenaceus]|uniref:Tyrosinase copper-binding domain-containing protein n=1 Tax=Aspergillus avenaceus TaxID=36643 RepID=A0A5N6U4R0_ASPAV|nr:hypothetical protein BDV25DRAFT_168743 [Aspergillus avenaceus]